MSPDANKKTLCVAFLHPDLGIGGAERLVVDASLALQLRGHHVRFFTSHHDKNHCFPETRDQIPVTVAGSWFPRSFFGRCYALCAYIRMILTALYLVLFSNFKPDVIFCDQISACIPFMRMCSRVKIVFYCHFPDQLLTKRETNLKALYRKPIDWLEEKSTGLADKILVNSQFTAGVFHDTFRSLNVAPEILYPSLNVKSFSEYSGPKDTYEEFTFLSINRYERKKNLGLAIAAFAKLKSRHPEKRMKLTMAGGYDPRVTENIQHFSELQKLADENGLLASGEVKFLMSPSDAKKLELLHRSSVLIYTPSGEHFGIVPIEAMFCGLPVIAVNNGGPTETVVNGETGFLRDSNPEEFAEAMETFYEGGNDMKKEFGSQGKKRVEKHFSFKAFGDRLESFVINNC